MTATCATPQWRWPACQVNMMVQPSGAPRVRRDIQSILVDGAAGEGELAAYAAAVRIMRQIDADEDQQGLPANPLGWRYQAALHGISTGEGVPLTADRLWNSCRHNSWFFFAWHRMYLYRFERIVQFHLGDERWSLPYWDYTKGTDASRVLPAPFRVDSPGNALFARQRREPVNAGVPLRPELCDPTEALKLLPFALPRESAASSFGGGIVDDIRPTSDARGSYENLPHGTVHGGVGGLMGAFATAALDPIFWLHHANIDRMWEVWLGLPDRTNPSNEIWLDTEFTLYDTNGLRVDQRIGDILDTEAMGYRYESIAPPPGFAPAPVPPGVQPPAAEALVSSPQLVGATTDVAFRAPVTVPITVEPPAAPFPADPGAGDPTQDRWFLRVEGVTGQRPDAAAFAVFVDVDGTGPAAPVHVGTVAAFGIEEASRRDEVHDGTGLTDVFDITAAVQALRADGRWDDARWDERRVLVTIEPIGAADEAVSGGDVRARRVSLYRGSSA